MLHARTDNWRVSDAGSNNCAILVWSTVDQGWAGTRNGTKLMSVLINNPSELFIPQWMIRSGETLSYPLGQTGNCKPYRRVIHAFMDEKFNSAASKLFHTSIIHPLVQSFSRAVCAPACVCGFAAFHCLSFPSPCSLAAIFHWFRGFKRFLLIALGFFYFFIFLLFHLHLVKLVFGDWSSQQQHEEQETALL